MFTGVMASATVTDPNRAQEWYTKLGGHRILQITDPDGNRIVFAGV